MLVLVAVTIILLIIAAAFSIDVAYMQLTRTQLRTSTDAAARAANEVLSRTQSIDLARAAARTAAEANRVAGAPLLLDDSDILFGHANVLSDGKYDFSADTRPYNSIRVTGRRTPGSRSGPVGLLFAGVFTTHTFNPVLDARTTNLDRDICIVADRSGSMNYTVATQSDPPGHNRCSGPHPTLSRWGGLDQSMTTFLSLLNQTDLDEFVGMVSYSSTLTSSCGVSFVDASIESPLSNNYALIQAAMDRYNTTGVAGWTNIAAGIDAGVQVLMDPTRTRQYAEKTLVVLTDGRENRPEGVDALGTTAPLTPRGAVRAAMDAKAAYPEIIVHTITFSDHAYEDTMKEVARVGEGKHWHAPTTARLEEIFTEIALTLPVVMVE